MALFIAIFLGLLIGSFLNVCIYRVPRQKSVVTPPRSYCPKCENQLTWWENIPVVSWILLGGKCRKCKAPISFQYPFVELLSAVGAGMSFIHFGVTPTAVVVYALVATLIVITFIDFEFRIIPNVISYPGVTIGLLLGITSQYTHVFNAPVTQSAWDSLIGMYAGGGFFYLMGEVYYWFTKREGLGGGDVKLMGMVGAVLGWQAVMPTIFLGSLAGAAIGILLIAIRGGGRHTEIPFGPWLSLGAIIHIFFDPPFFKF